MILVEEELVHQCAWCMWLIVDSERVRECHELLDVSHGICKECLEIVECSEEVPQWAL